MKAITYRGSKTREISFPLGGIGTGCIGLAGNGSLIDFEIFGKPNKKRLPGFTFFAVKASRDGEFLDARVLNGDAFGTRTGFDQYTERPVFSGYGYGPAQATMAGIPHFPATDFEARFPYASMTFRYEKFPGVVKMTAFNPFIPFNYEDSSIPAAFFEFEIENTSDKATDYTLCGVVENPLEDGRNVFDGEPVTDMKCIRLTSRKKTINEKELCIATDCDAVSYQECLLRGNWSDKIETFWNDLKECDYFRNRSYPDGSQHDPALLAAHVTLAPGEKRTVRFVLSWYMHYMTNDWNPIGRLDNEDDESYFRKNSWRNYYALFFESAHECAVYCFRYWERLKKETDRFTDNLFEATVPDEVLDAVSANLCILKTPTVMRHSDGNIIAFEGSHASSGSCEGNCTHVYNYAYTLAHLFPKLERGLRETEYTYCMNEYGAVAFRTPAPLGRLPDRYFPCADGQFGGILKVYREFKMTGDVEWLREMWGDVKKSLEFAWNEHNDFRWDPDKTGVLSGRQHNTLDTELYSPNSWLDGLYVAALKAAAEMASILKDKKKAAEYTALYEAGKAYLNTKLFNGQYFCQKIDLADRSLLEPFRTDDGVVHTWQNDVYSYYWSDENGELRYQIGEGSSVDQVLAQWHADNIGLGEIFEKDKLDAALHTLYTVNFKRSMRDHFNPCRNFCINDEAGVVICEYPEGARRPKIPIPYAEECMNGFEYAAAVLMIREGMVDEGLEIVRAIRARYDGEYRNPFAEMECGSDYARSMASFTLLGAMSGLSYDMYNKCITFVPLLQFADRTKTFRCPFFVGESQGFIEVGPDYIQMKFLTGGISLRRFTLHTIPRKVYYGGRNIGFSADGNTAVLENVLPFDVEHDIMVIFD